MQGDMGAVLATPAEQLHKQLRELYELVNKPPVRRMLELAELAEIVIGRSTIYDILKKRGVPTWRKVIAFIDICRQVADVHIPPVELPQKWRNQQWLEHLEALCDEASRADRSLARTAPEGATDSRKQRNANSNARTVNEWDPVALGVHRSIGGDPLPIYVPRDHDQKLRSLLSSGDSAARLVVLLGGSSTGKTRSALEAVRNVLPLWGVVHPADSKDLAGLLASGLRPCSVLWIDEFLHYADRGRHSRRAIASLRATFQEAQHLVVITTMWREDWDMIARPSELRLDDGYAQARALLNAVPQDNVIEVPEAFSAREQERVQRLAPGTTLAKALTIAGESGRIAQALAGAPNLLAHYDGHFHSPLTESSVASVDGTAPGGHPCPYGWALITAAMDAVRLGHERTLPAVLLEDAAAGYLTAEQNGDAGGDWFSIGLSYATRPLRGAFRALAPVACRPGGQKAYRLADYLDQHGRRSRRAVPVPASLWDALHAHVGDPDTRVQLCDAARKRCLFRYGYDFIQPVSQESDQRLIREVAVRLGWLGQAELAEHLLTRAVNVGDHQAHWPLIELLRNNDRRDEAAVLLSRAIEDRQLWQRVEKLVAYIYGDGAAALLSGWKREWERDGYSWNLETLLKLASADWEHPPSKHNQDSGGVFASVRVGEEVGVGLFATSDLPESVLRRAIEVGYSLAHHLLIEKLEQCGRNDEAGRLLRFGIVPGGDTSDSWGIHLNAVWPPW